MRSILLIFLLFGIVSCGMLGQPGTSEEAASLIAATVADAIADTVPGASAVEEPIKKGLEYFALSIVSLFGLIFGGNKAVEVVKKRNGKKKVSK